MLLEAERPLGDNAALLTHGIRDELHVGEVVARGGGTHHLQVVAGTLAGLGGIVYL